MKTNFKQLGLATAVAAATAGYAGITQAALSNNGLGDMAIVPYYTVQGDFVTGVHIINTSDMTQVVKLRLRRASDSMDALDFNLIMSPFDEWTGYIKNDVEGGQITFNSTDTTYTTIDADKEITIRHLLAHTSGLGYGMIDGDEQFMMIYKKAGIIDGFSMADVSIEENIKKLAKLPLHHNPGDDWTYSEGLDVLGYFIDAFSKQ